MFWGASCVHFSLRRITRQWPKRFLRWSLVESLSFPESSLWNRRAEKVPQLIQYWALPTWKTQSLLAPVESLQGRKSVFVFILVNKYSWEHCFGHTVEADHTQSWQQRSFLPKHLAFIWADTLSQAVYFMNPTCTSVPVDVKKFKI